MRPACSIIIRAFNEEKHIGRLLDGISQQTLRNVQVILVDSGSTDGTVTIAQGKGAEIVRIDPREFTFGRSLNIGMAKAKADIAVIASAHVYPVYPDWIEKLLAPFSDPSIALVYGKQRGAASSHFSEKQIFTHWYGDHSAIPQPHPFCNNANAAVRHSLWEKRPYDENLPGLEDLEWAQWAMDHQHKIAYAAEAEVIHVHNESWRGIHNRYLREGMAFKLIYPQEHFNRSDQLRLFWQNALSDLRQSIHERIFLKESAKILRFRWLQFLGTYRGYKRSGPLTWQLRQSFYYPRNHMSRGPHAAPRGIDPIEYSD